MWMVLLCFRLCFCCCISACCFTYIFRLDSWVCFPCLVTRRCTLMFVTVFTSKLTRERVYFDIYSVLNLKWFVFCLKLCQNSCLSPSFPVTLLPSPHLSVFWFHFKKFVQLDYHFLLQNILNLFLIKYTFKNWERMWMLMFLFSYKRNKL